MRWFLLILLCIVSTACNAEDSRKNGSYELVQTKLDKLVSTRLTLNYKTLVVSAEQFDSKLGKGMRSGFGLSNKDTILTLNYVKQGNTQNVGLKLTQDTGIGKLSILGNMQSGKINDGSIALKGEF